MSMIVASSGRCNDKKMRDKRGINEKGIVEEEESFHSEPSYFTLIRNASAMSDGKEINMSLTICTPIHLPLQHAARVCATTATTAVTASNELAFYKLLGSVT